MTERQRPALATLARAWWLLIVLQVVAAARPVPARASEAPQAPTVYVGVYLRDVSRFDQREGIFDVDADVWLKWRGDFDPEAVTFANLADARLSTRIDDRDGEWRSARWRLRGTLRGEFPLHAFPFDVQGLPVVFELPVRDGRLVPDLAASAVAERFSLTDWIWQPRFRPEATTAEYASDLGSLAGEGLPTVVNRVAFTVEMQRPIGPVVLKLFLPLGILLCVAFLALLMHPSALGPRASIGVTTLLACFAFQFAVSDALPPVAYLTLADRLFVISYFATALALLTTLVSYGYHDRGKTVVARSVDVAAVGVLAAATFVAVLVALPTPPRPSPTLPDPLPASEHPASARDVLRVGTTLLPSAAGSAMSAGAHWSVGGPDRSVPWLVTRMPGIENDALRFLPQGQLEVRWQLRPGLAWSDGAPLTAQDLALPFEASASPMLLAVETPDEETLILRWSDRVAEALQAPSPWPGHILGPIFEAEGHEAVMAHRRNAAFPGLGPYRMTAFAAGDHLVLETNPHFVGPPPAIGRVEVRHFEDRDALIAAFEAGEIDLVEPNSVTFEQALDVAVRRPDAAHIRPSSVFVFLHPDLEHPHLADPSVRRALLEAIDREALAAAVHGPAGRVAHAPWAGALPAGLERVAHAPDVARVRLGALRWEAPLTLTYGASPVGARTVEAVAEAWRGAGVPVEVREIPSSAGPWRARRHGGMLLHVLRASRDVSPAMYWALPIVDGRYDLDHRDAAYDGAVQDLLERRARALYPERREQLDDALLEAFAERLPLLPLVFASERVLADPCLVGWQGPPEARFARTLERWHFEAPGEGACPAGPASPEVAADEG
jgi:ABC-type transport system substrate-binding protein